MPLVRPRFTIRRLMVAVAISAVVAWVWVRYRQGDAFERLLIAELAGVIIIFGGMIGACVTVAALIGRSNPPPR